MNFNPGIEKNSSDKDDGITETWARNLRTDEGTLSIASISNDLDEEHKKIALQKKKLEIEKVSIELEKERSSAEIALRRQKLDLDLKEKNLQMQLDFISKRQEVELQEQFESSKYYRQLCRAQSRFKMIVSIVLIITGIWQLYRGDNLGAFLLGTGAGGAGIQPVSDFLQNRHDSNFKSTPANQTTNGAHHD